MASKVQERIYAEAAAALLRTDWLIVDIPEPLDFEVRSASETFGLEVRQVFVDAEAEFGSPAKRNESVNVKAISVLAMEYYDSGGPPILAKFFGQMSSVTKKALIELMVAAAPIYPGPSKTIDAHDLKVTMTPLSASFPNYSRWAFVNHRVGWLKPITVAVLQHAINRKEANLDLYKQKFDNVELLLVADRTFNSGKLVEVDDLVVNNPGFRTVYFMSYPESIQRVG
jgi:hypothetical protein